MSKTREYKIWAAIIDRCTNPNSTGYYKYGSRGITVCDRWKASFSAFWEDMGPRPSSQHSIDRINNDGPYSPENCQWATAQVQQKNTRRSVVVEFNGKLLNAREIADITGIPRATIAFRIQRGWEGADLARPTSWMRLTSRPSP